VSLTVPHAQFFENNRECRKCGIGYLDHGVIGDPIPEFVKEYLKKEIEFQELHFAHERVKNEIDQLKTFLNKEKFDHNFQEPPSKPPGYVRYNLEDYYTIKKFLGDKYGGPRISEDDRKLYDGSHTFFIILEHLANHGPSTCKEIAESWYKKEKKRKHSKRNVKKSKSINDQITRFLKNSDSLKIFRKVVNREKSNGRPSNVYDLNEFGILYSIYFLSKSSEDWNLIQNLAKRNSDIFPLIFGNFFKKSKIFENYKDECVNALQNIAGHNVIVEGVFDKYTEKKAIIYDYISTMRFFSKKDLKNQITVAFFVQLWSEIDIKSFYPVFKKMDLLVDEKSPKEYRRIFLDESQKHDMESNKKWAKILKSDFNLNKLIQEVVANGMRFDEERILTGKEILEILPP